VAEIRAIFEEQRPKFEALHGDASEDREGRREAFMELREETHARVSAVLTEEQRARFEELKRSHEGHHGPRGGGHRGS
jgi:Spy/CpxP family protein refolding chaperone